MRTNPEQSPHHNTTQYVHPLYFYNVSDISLHLPLTAWKVLVLCLLFQSKISANAEKLNSSFLLQCDQLITLPELHSASLDWSLFQSTADLLEQMLISSLQWMASWRTPSSRTQVTLSLLLMGGCIKQSTLGISSLQHLRPMYSVFKSCCFYFVFTFAPVLFVLWSSEAFPNWYRAN